MTTSAPIPAPKSWGVSLFMRVTEDDASNPAAAVDAFLERILQFGLRGFTYTVEDNETGELLYVENGTIFTEEQYRAAKATGDGGQ